MNDLVEGLNNLKISKWLVFVPHPYTKKYGLGEKSKFVAFI